MHVTLIICCAFNYLNPSVYVPLCLPGRLPERAAFSFNAFGEL